MFLFSYLRCALFTTWNIVLNGLTFDGFLWLEGRVRSGIFRNWARRFRYRPPNFDEPPSEADLVKLVTSGTGIRVFGSAHSFNSGIHADQTLVSLDRHCGVVHRDPEARQMTVHAGTRVRDVVRHLLDNGLAFSAMPSHDAQSIAGILSTDVHGTGRDWGFVSESVAKMKVVDGRGEVVDCKPGCCVARPVT